MSDPRLSGNNQNIYISSVLSLEHIHAKVYTCRVNAGLIIIKRSPDICNKLLKWNIATMICLHCLGHCRLQWFWLNFLSWLHLSWAGNFFFFCVCRWKEILFFLYAVNRLHLFVSAAKAFWKPQTLLRLLHQGPSWARAAAGEAWGVEPAAVRGSVPQLCHWHWGRGNQAVGPARGKLLLTEQFYF